MKLRNLFQASPPEAQKRQGICLFECAGLCGSVLRLKYRRFGPLYRIIGAFVSYIGKYRSIGGLQGLY